MAPEIIHGRLRLFIAGISPMMSVRQQSLINIHGGPGNGYRGLVYSLKKLIYFAFNLHHLPPVTPGTIS